MNKLASFYLHITVALIGMNCVLLQNGSASEFVPLGNFPGGFNGSGGSVLAFSDNRDYIVGVSISPPPSFPFFSPVLWAADGSLLPLTDPSQEILPNGITNNGAIVIGEEQVVGPLFAADGLSIVGSGINPDGNFEAWLVRLDRPLNIPEPTALLLAAVGLANLVVLVYGNHE